MPSSYPTAIAPPPLRLLTAEPLRAAFEYAKAHFPGGRAAPRGDGHTVVVFPGLATDERFIEPLRLHCERLGYRARGWGRGFNTGPKGDLARWVGGFASEVEALSRASDQQVSLIGWSLGGLYAREIAKRVPHAVRRVITIGSPLHGLPRATHAGWLMRLLSDAPPVVDQALARRLRTPPPVPTTAIFSRSDGVVAWQACVDEGAAGVEHVEVDSSHMGLVWHRDVLMVVGERLARARSPARRASPSRRARAARRR